MLARKHLLAVLLVLALLSAVFAESGSGWEWAGAFMVTPGQPYTWVANKVDGAYAAEEMEMLILSATAATADGIEAVKAAADAVWASGATPITMTTTSSGGITTGALHSLQFNTEAFASMFQITFNTSVVNRDTTERAFVVFTQHDPAEFDGTLHYLLDAEGEEVAAGATFPEATTGRQANVGEAIGAAFCVALASLIGVVLLVPSFAWIAKSFDLLHAIDAFASGALLSLIFCIMVPEALPNIAAEYPGEAATAGWFAALIMTGFAVPLVLDWLIHLLFPGAGGGHGHGHGQAKHLTVDEDLEKHDPTATTTTNEGDAAAPVTYPTYQPGYFDPASPGYLADPTGDYPTGAPTPIASIDAPRGEGDEVLQEDPAPPKKRGVVRSLCACCPLTAVAWSITIGDGVHNFTDGVLIGVAFRFCGSSFGWAVAGASVVHELASELSEFWLLINPEIGGLTWLQALLLNFATSLTIVMGCLISSYVRITSFTLGLLLAFGAGLLLYIGTVPIWSRLQERTPTLSFVLTLALAFTLGAVAIGLVLLSHTHCAVEGDAHSGHDH